MSRLHGCKSSAHVTAPCPRGRECRPTRSGLHDRFTACLTDSRHPGLLQDPLAVLGPLPFHTPSRTRLSSPGKPPPCVSCDLPLLVSLRFRGEGNLRLHVSGHFKHEWVSFSLLNALPSPTEMDRGFPPLFRYRGERRKHPFCRQGALSLAGTHQL